MRQKIKNRNQNNHGRGRERERRQEYSGFGKEQYSNKLQETAQTGLYRFKRIFVTKNMTPGKLFFEQEKEILIQGKEYREVDPKRSKFVSAIAKGLQQTGMLKTSTVLYLGASHGYTPSFFSDMVSEGMIFCLDFAPRVVRDLYFVCEKRNNMAPILGDANKPEDYVSLVPEVDVIFQDIAQRDQVSIFLKNCDAFLKKDGFGMLAIKARSIDVTKKPEDIFKEIKKSFEGRTDYVVVDYRELAPFERDHAFFTIKKK